MAEDGITARQDTADSLRDMHLKEEAGENADVDMDTIPVAESLKRERSAAGTPAGDGTPGKAKRASRSPVKDENGAHQTAIKGEHEELVGGDVTLKLEPGKPPKLARTNTQKIEKRPPQLYFDYDDKTAEATSTFTVLPDCTYANKYLGTTETALECDCAEEWGM
jgi:[histone H3]-lysine36 N-trimethyltransferase